MIYFLIKKKNDLNFHEIYIKKKNNIYNPINVHSKMLKKKNESLNNCKINNYGTNERQISNKFHLKNIAFKFKPPIKKNNCLPKIKLNSNLMSINNSTLNCSLDDLSCMKNSNVKLYPKKKQLHKNLSCPVIKNNKGNFNKMFYYMKFKK